VLGTGSPDGVRRGLPHLLVELASSPFLRYLLRRLILSLGVVLGVAVIVFFLSRVLPGDPALLWVGTRPRPEQLAAARRYLHLDEPFHVQLAYYFWNLLHLDLGTSISTRNPVTTDIANLLPASVELVVSAMAIALLVGIPLGVLSALHRNRVPDHASRVAAIAGVSIPAFWLALLLQLVFVVRLGVLPLHYRVDDAVLIAYPLQRITGFYLLDSLLTGNLPVFANALSHIILPAITVAAYPLGLVARMVRTMMIQVLGEGYIRTARAYGIPRFHIHYVYALKNAIAPAIVILGLSFAYSIVGALVVERVFAWPGLGKYTFEAILSRDYPAIVGVTIVISIIYVAVNLTTDLLQAFLDRRVAFEGATA
jgi:peptide/nickel transport system permease protein